MHNNLYNINLTTRQSCFNLSLHQRKNRNVLIYMNCSKYWKSLFRFFFHHKVAKIGAFKSHFVFTFYIVMIRSFHLPFPMYSRLVFVPCRLGTISSDDSRRRFHLTTSCYRPATATCYCYRPLFFFSLSSLFLLSKVVTRELSQWTARHLESVKIPWVRRCTSWLTTTATTMTTVMRICYYRVPRGWLRIRRRVGTSMGNISNKWQLISWMVDPPWSRVSMDA